MFLMWQPSRFLLRIAMVQVAILHFIIAYGIWITDDVALRYATAGMFTMAGILCAAVAVVVTNLKVVALAGAFTITSYLSRAALVFHAAVISETSEILHGRTIVVVASWVLLSIYSFIVFVKGVAPESRVQQIAKMNG